MTTIPILDTPVPRVSVVAPCYNEQANLAELERRVSAACRTVAGESYEIVLVNDGSRDATWAGIQALARTKPNISGVNLSRNYGHQLALSAGLEACRGERILIIDADLQDPPELLGGMMKLMDDGFDVVYGRRLIRKGDSAIRSAASSVFYKLLRKMSDVDIPLDTGDFRIISRRVLDELKAMPEHHRFIRGMISWIGFRQTELLYERDPRLHGETSYTLAKLVRFAADAITGFSIRPLRVATYLGLGLALAALLFIVYSVVLWEQGAIPVAGWMSIITAIVLFSSLQLCFLGLLGEYLGRIFIEVKGRPLFIVESVVRSPE